MGNRFRVGIDEVGVGALFGPLVVVATCNMTGWFLDGIRDSKKIKSERVRQALASEIQHNMLWCSASMKAEHVDRFGPHNVIQAANVRLIHEIAPRIREIVPNAQIEVVVDGAGPTWTEDGCHVMSIPKADSTVFEVSAASILAKVICDNWIHAACVADPSLRRYGLDSNKGYFSEAHRIAIEKHGPTPHHRISFIPKSVLAIWEQSCM